MNSEHCNVAQLRKNHVCRGALRFYQSITHEQKESVQILKTIYISNALSNLFFKVVSDFSCDYFKFLPLARLRRISKNLWGNTN